MEVDFRVRATAGKLRVHKTDTVGKDDMRGRTRLSFQRQQEETGQREGRRLPMAEQKDSRAAQLPEEEGLEERYERYRRIIRDFTLMSDIFMRNVCKETACVEHILRVIMRRPDLQIEESIIQKDYKNMQGRSACLDCVARDTEKKRYNLEVQQRNAGAPPERARYHGGLMDMNTLREGQDFKELPEGNVIFITRGDVLGGGLPIYHVRKKIDENGGDFGDGQYILYVNSAIRDEGTELGRLMHDFHCKNADDMYSEILARRVRQLKESKKEVDDMCKEMDDIYKEGQKIGEERGIKIGEALGEARGEERGIKIGETQGMRRMALSMAEEGISVERIASMAKESVELIRQWIAEGATAVK